MTYDVVKYTADTWAVEAMDLVTADVYQTVFRGPQAQDRAKQYAAWVGIQDDEAPKGADVTPRPSGRT